MFKIGEFSKLVRVSPRMLRHYEKCGLVYPAEIDRFTGYRQYGAAQIPLLAKITALRDMGFSIDEIGEILPRFGDKAYMERILRAKAAQVESTIEAARKKLGLINGMSDAMRKELINMVYEVELKKLPAVKVLSLRSVIPHYKDEGMLWGRLMQYVAENAIPCENSGYSVYYDEEYKEANPDVEIAIPVAVMGKSEGGFVYREYAEISIAATVRFSGPFQGNYDLASEKLASWMEQNGYAFAGPLRGQVITPPDESGNQDACLTELQAPVRKL